MRPCPGAIVPPPPDVPPQTTARLVTDAHDTCATGPCAARAEPLVKVARGRLSAPLPAPVCQLPSAIHACLRPDVHVFVSFTLLQEMLVNLFLASIAMGPVKSNIWVGIRVIGQQINKAEHLPVCAKPIQYWHLLSLLLPTFKSVNLSSF